MKAISRITTFSALAGAAALFSSIALDSSSAQDDAKKKDADTVNVIILTGQNNHNWKTTSALYQDILTKHHKFSVTVETSPARGEKDKMKDWKVDFSKAHVVLNDYNGQSWSDSVNEGLLDFVKKGGGLVNVHAGNNPFSNWPEFNEMIGLGWRNNMFGDRISIDDTSGKQIRTKRGKGPGAGHGRQHEFVVKVRNTDHPIMKGIPSEWLHGKDELYHGQRGPGNNMNVLSSAYSDKKTGGTGEHEPITWIIPYGKGQSVTTVLGHQGGGNAADAVACAGFQTVLLRCLEWAATGKVTIDVPKNFPAKGKTSFNR